MLQAGAGVDFESFEQGRYGCRAVFQKAKSSYSVKDALRGKRSPSVPAVTVAWGAK